MPKTFIYSTMSLALILLTGCSTVADIAQNVADKARGGSSTSPENKTDKTRTASQSPQEPCVANFTVTGSFFTGKQFKSKAPLASLNPDTAYRKAHASVVSRGWQIVSADKDMRAISANQQVSFSNGGKTTPLNILIQPDTARGSIILFTFSIAGGLVTSEQAVRDGFCQFTRDLTA